MVFFEARDQDIYGQTLVADVVLNRVEDSHFPKDVCSVVYEPHQFSFTEEPHKSLFHVSDKLAAATAVVVAYNALSDDYRLTEATHYHTSKVTPEWSDSYDVLGKYGDHVFYRCVGNTC